MTLSGSNWETIKSKVSKLTSILDEGGLGLRVTWSMSFNQFASENLESQQRRVIPRSLSLVTSSAMLAAGIAGFPPDRVT